MLQKVQFLCGASLNEYNGTGDDRDEEMLKHVFVRENISGHSVHHIFWISTIPNVIPAVENQNLCDANVKLCVKVTLLLVKPRNSVFINSDESILCLKH